MKLTDKDLERFWEKIDKRGVNECWLWLASVVTAGYGAFWLNNSIQGAHRVVWIIENKCEIPVDKPCILHSCNNPRCCNPKHLRIGTHQENMDDMIKDGRQARGEKNGGHKLTKQQVVEIFLSTDKQCILAKKYGVVNSAISNIKSGKKWELLTKGLTRVYK